MTCGSSGNSTRHGPMKCSKCAVFPCTESSFQLSFRRRMQADRDTFGPRLRLERERRGIELKAIADATKIKESLFAELERNDFSKWPQGIFRRAHLCAYVSAIGLPSQAVLAEFLQLFPESPPIQPCDSHEA